VSANSIASPEETHATLDRHAGRLLWVFAFAVLICIRMPAILIHGRFWAEEGSPIFQDAWTMPWYGVLTPSYGGYLSIVPNLAGLFARHLVPLDYARSL